MSSINNEEKNNEEENANKLFDHQEEIKYSEQTKPNYPNFGFGDYLETRNFNEEFVCDLIRKKIENEMKIKHDISTFNGRIITHIYEKLDRGHNQVFDYKFRDYLLSIGYDKTSSNQAIHFLEDSFDGSLDLNELKTFFNSFTNINWSFKANMHLKKLLNCSLMPGFIDSFLNENLLDNYNLLWQKMFKFLINHRLSAEMINEPYLESRITVASMRRKILFEIEKNLQEESIKNKSICVDQQCFTNIRVCCSREKSQNLIDGKMHTFWQTSNLEKCENHWILINIKENIKLTQLIMSSSGNRNDDFLKSVVIEVRAGTANKIETIISKCDYNLTLNNDYLLCSCFPTDQSIAYLKIIFKRNTEKNFWGKNSDQIKIKTLKLIGKKEVKNLSKITVQDASICWYFEMLSSLTLIQSQIVPSFYAKILQISKVALQNIPPLSLTLESKESFLTPNVLAKVDNFFKNFLETIPNNSQEKAEAIVIYLSFNLARGHLKSILNSLSTLLENFDIKYDTHDLIKQIDEASQLSLRKAAQPQPIKMLRLNESTESKTDNISINCSSDESSEFCIEPYSIANLTKSNSDKSSSLDSSHNTDNPGYTILLSVEDNTTITNVNFKLKLDSIGVKSVVVIMIFNEQKPTLDAFEQFNNFDMQKYIDYKENLDKNKNDDYQISYFDLYENQIDIFLELPVFYLVKYLMIKLVRPKESTSKPISITHFKTIGCKHDEFKLHDELRKMQKLSKNLSEDTSVLINSILWFLSDLAEQNKANEKYNEDLPKFLNFDAFDITDLWSIYDKAIEVGKKLRSDKAQSKEAGLLYFNLRIPILVLLYQLVNCNDIKCNTESSKENNKSYQFIFEKLCQMIDKNDENDLNDYELNTELKALTKTITSEILKNGLMVFFPSETERKDYFMSMIEKNTEFLKQQQNQHSLPINEEKNLKLDVSFQRPSTKLIFEAFCNLFCTNKTNLIQHLIRNSASIFESSDDCERILFLIDKIIKLGFAFSDNELFNSPNATVTINDNDDRLLYALNELLNSIQSHAFFNIKQQLDKLSGLNQIQTCNSNVDIISNIKNTQTIQTNITCFTLKYARLLVDKSKQIINTVLEQIKEAELTSNLTKFTNIKSLINSKLKFFFNKIIYNFVLWLMEIINQIDLTSCTNLIEILIEFHKLFAKIEPLFSDHDYKLPENEKVLKSWTFNTKSRSSLTELLIQYNYPLANKFVIEFDSTSNLGSNLENQNSDNEKIHSFSGKIGTTSWKEKMEIKSNTFLMFSIHSNKDLKLNSSFFIKFTISAIGFDHLSSSVLCKDLIDSLTCLIGLHLSRAYSEKIDLIETSTKSDNNIVSSSDESKNKTIINLNSDLYKVLLRGGYNKLNFSLYKNQLNSSNVNNSNENDTKLLKFLNKLTNFYELVENDSKESEDEVTLEKVRRFMFLYDNSFESNEKALERAKIKYGGFHLTELVLKIFVSLIWHSPAIKYKDLFNQDNFDDPIKCDLVDRALKCAESTKMFILEQLQLYRNKRAMTNSDEENIQRIESRPLISILNEKVEYLLKFERLSDLLVTFESNKNDTILKEFNISLNEKTKNINTLISNETSNIHQNHLISSEKNDNNSAKKKKTRFPKADKSAPDSFNMVLEFIFDKHVSNLQLLNKCLIMKRESAILTTKNLHLAKEFVENLLSNEAKKFKDNLETILILLSNFFAINSTQIVQQTTKNVNPKANNVKMPYSSKYSCPATLQFNKIHYLNDLYGCGSEAEEQLRSAYYQLLIALLNYSNMLKKQDESSFEIIKSLVIRLDSFLISFFDIDWEIFDLKYLYETNVVNYLIKNIYRSYPISYFKDKSLTNTQVLEEVFSLSKEKFNNASISSTNKYNKTLSVIMEEQNNNTSLNKSDETEAKVEQAEHDEDSNSFDMKIYPKLYQSVFQTVPSGSNKTLFDTESLIKCLCADIKTFEQYEKFVVARYMFWKYFSRLKTNFYCNSCDIVLNGNRYVCLECYDHCLCLTCFSRSVITDETKNTVSEGSPTANKLFNKYNSSTHKPSHKMLLLDHICDQCSSLIIGKRISCQVCEDFDLCLMCSRDFHHCNDSLKEKKSNCKHEKDHKTIVNEPVIMVAKSDEIIDAQVYLYMHSQFLFSILTLKLSDLLVKVKAKEESGQISSGLLKQKPSNNLYFNYAKNLHANCFNLIMFMIGQTSIKQKSIDQNKENSIVIDRLKCFAMFNQEYLIGLLSSAIKTSSLILKTQKRYDLYHKEELCNFINIKKNILKENENYSLKFGFSNNMLIKFVLNILTKNNEYQFDDFVYIMLINIFKLLLIDSDPDHVNKISKDLVADMPDRFKRLDDEEDISTFSLQLILHFIDEFMQANHISIASSYFSIFYELNENGKWKSYVVKFLRKLFDESMKLLEVSECLTQSRLFNFFYVINCSPTLISSGVWIEFKNDSRYDGAGVLKSNLDFKLGIIKLINSDSYPTDYFINVIEPESRKLSVLKSKKFGVDFKKPERVYALIQKEAHRLNLDESIIRKSIKMLKKLFAIDLVNPRSNELSTTIDSHLTNRQMLLNYELMHIKRKREFNQIFNQMKLNNSLLIFCLITLIKDYTVFQSKQLKMQQNVSNESKLNEIKSEIEDIETLMIFDYELLNLISKISFLNSNLNSNWKVTHLRQFLTSLLLEEGFNNLNPNLTFIENNEIVTVEEIALKKSVTVIDSSNEPLNEETSQPVCTKSHSNLKSKSSSSSIKISCVSSSSASELHQKSTTCIECKKRSHHREQTIEDLKLNLNSTSVLGICDAASTSSSSFFNFDDNFSQKKLSDTDDFSKPKRYKQSLKLLEDCMSKLIKYQSTSNSSGNSNTTNTTKQIMKQNNDSSIAKYNSSGPITNKSLTRINTFEPIKNAIKLVVNASTVLTCRELLILSINLSVEIKKKLDQGAQNKFSICLNQQLSCDTEFEFLQLLDILYHTDHSQRYNLFIKNLICELTFDEQQTKDVETNKLKIMSKIIVMACDFMLPEFKQIDKINWSSENSAASDQGVIKIKSNAECLTEEMVLPSFTATGTQANNLSSISNTSISKQALEIEMGTNLGAKPNDIEKISKNNETTLLIVFDVNKQPKSSMQSASFGSSTLQAMSNQKTKRVRLKKFVKPFKSKAKREAYRHSYFANDNFETNIKKEVKESCLYLDDENYDADDIIDEETKLNDASDTESVDSLRLNHSVAIGCFIASNKRVKILGKSNEIDNNKDNFETDDNDNENYKNISKSTKKHSNISNSKEGFGVKKCSSIQFQTISNKKSKSSQNTYRDDDTDEENRHEYGEDDDENESDETDEDDDEDSHVDTDDTYETSSSSDDENNFSDNYDDENDTAADLSSEYNEDYFNDSLMDIPGVVSHGRRNDRHNSNINVQTINDYFYNEDWYSNQNYHNSYDDDDGNRKSSKKSSFKLSLDSIDQLPYLSVINQKILKWKFIRREESDWTTDACSFKIFTCFSKNFESAFYLVDEMISQLDIVDDEKNDNLAVILTNEIWENLIRICCVQTFGRRLKIISLLIKIMKKIEICKTSKQKRICLFKLKPLKSLQYTLDYAYREDHNLSRALYELFFFAEKLAIKWKIEREYLAHMRDRDEFIEQFCDAAYFVNLIKNCIYSNTTKSEANNLNDSVTIMNKTEQTENSSNTESNRSISDDEDDLNRDEEDHEDNDEEQTTPDDDSNTESTFKNENLKSLDETASAVSISAKFSCKKDELNATSGVRGIIEDIIDDLKETSYGEEETKQDEDDDQNDSDDEDDGELSSS